MSTSLADLFATDSPPRKRPRSPSPASQASTPARNVRRPNNTLFLSPGGSPNARPRQPVFDDFDNEELFPAFDDDFESDPRDAPRRERSITPMNVTDLETLHGRMDAAGRAADEFFNDPFAMQDPLAAGGADEEPAKKKRVMATVNKDRLLGPQGFPALIKMAKRFRPKGKGHEVRDLHRILDVYQMWAHTMFPKGQFMYTVGRVEKIARTAGVRSALDGMHDAYKNPQAIPSAEYEFDPDIEAEAAAAASMAEERAHGVVVVGSNGPTSGPEPLFDQPDDFDFEDEFAAMEEMERGATAPRPIGNHAEDDDMDEMAAMEEMERELGSRENVPATSASTGVDGSLTAENTSEPASAKPPPLFGDEPPAMDEEDEWEGLYD